MTMLGRSHTLRVASEAWFDPFTMQVSSAVVSEGVNEAGRLSCIVDSDRVLKIGLNQWIGKWVRWEDETFGVWGGVVEAVDPRPDERTWEISAAGFATILGWRSTPIRYKNQAAPAGALVQRAYTDANADNPAWVSRFISDESGAPVLWEWRGDTVMETMRTLADQTGEEWYVCYEEDPATGVRDGTGIVVRWAREISVDGFSRPLIHEGIHQGTMSGPVLGAEIVNDILAIGNDSDIEHATRMRLTNQDSRADYGTRAITRRYSDVTSPSALQWRVRKELEDLGSPQRPITIDLARGSGIARKCKVGTIGYLHSQTLDYRGQFRILSRTLDVDAGILTIAGRRYP